MKTVAFFVTVFLFGKNPYFRESNSEDENQHSR